MSVQSDSSSSAGMPELHTPDGSESSGNDSDSDHNHTSHQRPPHTAPFVDVEGANYTPNVANNANANANDSDSDKSDDSSMPGLLSRGDSISSSDDDSNSDDDNQGNGNVREPSPSREITEATPARADRSTYTAAGANTVAAARGNSQNQLFGKLEKGFLNKSNNSKKSKSKPNAQAADSSNSDSDPPDLVDRGGSSDSDDSSPLTMVGKPRGPYTIEQLRDLEKPTNTRNRRKTRTARNNNPPPQITAPQAAPKEPKLSKGQKRQQQRKRKQQRDKLRQTNAPHIQKIVRRFLQQRTYQRTLQHIQLLQNNLRRYKCQKAYATKLHNSFVGNHNPYRNPRDAWIAFIQNVLLEYEIAHKLKCLKMGVNTSSTAQIHTMMNRYYLHNSGSSTRNGITKLNSYGDYDPNVFTHHPGKALPTHVGTWMEIKVASNVVVATHHDDPTDFVKSVMREVSLNNEEKVEEEDDLDYLTKAVETKPIKHANSTAPTESQCNVQFTSQALKWLRQQADGKYRELFIKRIEQLTSGDRSYCLSKPLKGRSKSSTQIWETKLDKGQRVIWTQRGSELLIWYVCKHDAISRCRELVDRSYERMAMDDGQELMSTNGKGGGHGVESIYDGIYPEDEECEAEILVDPSSNVPLKVHSVNFSQLPQLASDHTWIPPLKLTSGEASVVNKEGTVLLLGRSGTGKTLCVCNRMSRDRNRYAQQTNGSSSSGSRDVTTVPVPPQPGSIRTNHHTGVDNIHQRSFRQLFVARTQRLCDYVKALQVNSGENVNHDGVKFLTTSTLAEDLRVSLEQLLNTDSDPPATASSQLSSSFASAQHQWKARFHISYPKFLNHIWKTLILTAHTHKKSDRSKGKLDPLMVWTQIRSFIKGSYQAASQQSPLSYEQYADLPKARCRLDGDTRRLAYEVYLTYEEYLHDRGLWDDMDQIVHIVGLIQLQKLEVGGPTVWYDRVYVDEVQDITQAEIGLFFLLTGENCDALYLAGDTAQAVSQGVEFRFEEVRSVVHLISGGKQKIDRWEKLVHNYRSHKGILRVANHVLLCLHHAFPLAAAKLPLDAGLVQGPRPGLLHANFDQVTRLLEANQRLRVLVRDEMKEEIKSKSFTSDLSSAIFGIREAKGLEFSDVVIVDFFAGIKDKKKLQKAWKRLLVDEAKAVLQANKEGKARTKDALDVPLEMELELKLLYTGVTRGCNRVFFAESRETPGFSSLCRVLTENGLAVNMDMNNIIGGIDMKKIMTVDDWRCEGIEFASQAGSHDLTYSVDMLERALSNFKKAGDVALAERAHAHLVAVQFEKELSNQDFSNDDNQTNLYAEKAVNAATAYLYAGLVDGAARICKDYCNVIELNKLPERILKLSRLSSVNDSGDKPKN